MMGLDAQLRQWTRLRQIRELRAKRHRASAQVARAELMKTSDRATRCQGMIQQTLASLRSCSVECRVSNPLATMWRKAWQDLHRQLAGLQAELEMFVALQQAQRAHLTTLYRQVRRSEQATSQACRQEHLLKRLRQKRTERRKEMGSS